MIYTVFPTIPERMPQDFASYEDVKVYGDEWEDEYTIKAPTEKSYSPI